MATINEFREQHAFLSNFYAAPVRINGMLYPTAEHAYQAFKTCDQHERSRIACAATPGKAKRLGRTITMRPDWDAIKVQVMTAIVRAKFRQHPKLAAQLLGTSNAQLVEGNTWNDRFWGVDLATGIGENQLGQILMHVRTELADCAISTAS